MDALCKVTSKLAERCETWWRFRTIQPMLIVTIAIFTITLPACSSLNLHDSKSRTTEQSQDSASASTVSGIGSPVEIPTLSINPSNGTLVTANETGLYRSSDAGQTWEMATTPQDLDGEAILGALINPDDSTAIYAWGKGFGVVHSVDAGATWSPVIDGLPTDTVGALAMHSVERKTLYAWLEGHGVFRTKDGGQNWELMDEGPPVSDVTSLTHTPLEGSMNTGWLYAATPEGVYLSMDCF